ncbi:MAG: hypothetical protein IJB65_00780 [Clostridia bacterium]|nr:hypothetical protein [Clostridia bacterium]
MKKLRNKYIVLAFLLSALCIFCIAMAWIEYANTNGETYAIEKLVLKYGCRIN